LKYRQFPEQVCACHKANFDPIVVGIGGNFDDFGQHPISNPGTLSLKS
jgi:hypothetical protein